MSASSDVQSLISMKSFTILLITGPLPLLPGASIACAGIAVQELIWIYPQAGFRIMNVGPEQAGWNGGKADGEPAKRKAGAVARAGDGGCDCPLRLQA